MADNGREEAVEMHMRTSRQFILQAQEELNAGDRLQASEKAWGAAAHAVKALAQPRGWEHRTYARLSVAVDRIAEDAACPELRTLFSHANSLHQNFYENWQTGKFVQDGINQVRLLVEELQALS